MNNVTSGRGADTLRWQPLLLALLGILAARILYLVLLPYDLVGDEAYYWDWGRHPDFGYYSKPPMIAWIMSIAGKFADQSTWAIRIWSPILATMTLALGFLLARQLFDNRTASWFLATMALMPGSVVQNIVLTTDAPLLLFWTASLLLFWNWCESERGWRQDLFLAGLVVTLGLGYLSKQTMVAFPVFAFLFLLSDERLRRRLLWPRVYAAVALSFCFVMPTLLWNAAHDWITFEHTAHHFDERTFTIAAALKRFTELALGVLLALGPGIGVLAAVALARSIPRFGALTREERLLFVFSVPTLCGVCVLVLRQQINLNWAAVAVSMLLMLTVHWLLRPPGNGPFGPLGKAAFKPALAVSTALAVLVASVPHVIAFSDLAGSKFDPTSQASGWRALAQDVGRVHSGLEAQRTIIITVGHRYIASELAFYMPGQPRTYRWNDSGRVRSQYDLWPGPETKLGADALVVVDTTKGPLEPPQALVEAFTAWQALGRVAVPIGRDRYRSAQLFIGSGLRSWPPAQRDVGVEASRGQHWAGVERLPPTSANAPVVTALPGRRAALPASVWAGCPRDEA